MWTLSEREQRASRGWAAWCRCACGKEQWVAYADLRAGVQGCRSCVMSARMQRELAADSGGLKERLRAASAMGADATRKPAGLTAIRRIMQGAKKRCTKPNFEGYKDYGGRGIEFRFASAASAAEWVWQNLGPRPAGRSIDRIDNSGHYEAGNLRWATAQEQNRNKRDYCGPQYGHRLQKLLALRPDYTYEGLRKYINLGWTDRQILALEKPKGGRPRKC